MLIIRVILSRLKKPKQPNGRIKSFSVMYLWKIQYTYYMMLIKSIKLNAKDFKVHRRSFILFEGKFEIFL
jgi:hypothetical protein